MSPTKTTVSGRLAFIERGRMPHAGRRSKEPASFRLSSTLAGRDGFRHSHRPMEISEPRSIPAEPWVSVEDVAKHLGVARESVYRWIDGRRLPAHKIGRLWKFRLSEIDDWVRGDIRPDEKGGRTAGR